MIINSIFFILVLSISTLAIYLGYTWKIDTKSKSHYWIFLIIFNLSLGSLNYLFLRMHIRASVEHTMYLSLMISGSAILVILLITLIHDRNKQ